MANDFGAAGAMVRSRLTRALWYDYLAASALPVFGAAVAAAVAARLLGGPSPGAPYACLLAGLLVAAWLAAARACARLGRPSAVEALAHWDERAGRNEQFLSAYCFETRADESRGEGERLHLKIALSRLGDERARLREHIPCRLAPRAGVAPALFVAFAGVVGSGLLDPGVYVEDARLDEAAKSAAREAGTEMAEAPDSLDSLEGLTPEELKRVEKLKASVEATAEALQKLKDETPREVLEDLERRAREAEGLAEALGNGDADILSEGVIAELERHADTAELAAALRAKDLGKISREAEKLAKKLRGDPTVEEQGRLEDALSRALREASATDLRNTMGRGLAEALAELKKKRLLEAADKLSNISKKFARKQQRRRSRRQLQRLANRLRSAGQKMFGSSGGLKQLKAQRYARRGSLRSGKLRPVGTLPPGMRRGARQGRLGVPGQQTAGLPAGTPIAGAQPGMGPTPVPGGPMGQAPVPGAAAGSMSGAPPIPGGGPGAGAGQTPVPGGGAGAAMSAAGTPQAGGGVGGLKAGHGTAPLGAAATRPTGASSMGVVNAAAGPDGEAYVRRIAGAMNAEEAARGFSGVAMQLIMAEEDALDAEPLPLSRREQVLRYFMALRRQIQETDAGDGSD